MMTFPPLHALDELDWALVDQITSQCEKGLITPMEQACQLKKLRHFSTPVTEG